MDLVDSDCQGVGLGDDEFDEVKFVVRPVVFSSPIPILTCADYCREDRVDLYGGPLAVEHHLGPKSSGVRRERGLEPAKVDLFDQLEIDRPCVG